MNKPVSGIHHGMTGVLQKSLFVAALIMLIFSCKVSRHTTGKITKIVPADTAYANEINTKLKDNIFDFEWFSGKAKVSLVDSVSTREVNANIRIRRDSIIWISVSAIGFEGLRILMTQDSIYVIDRLNKKYYIRDYSFFTQYTSIPVNYGVLQNIIAGVPLYFDEKKLKAHKEDNEYVLLSNGKKKSSTIYLNPDYTMLNMDVVDSTLGKSLKLRYKNYNRDNEKPFALDRELELDDAQNTHVLINFSKVVINQPQKFPFNVKEKYE